MVDGYGNWTAEKDYTNYPAEKLCDCDRVAMMIMADGYVPKTSIENIAEFTLFEYEYYLLDEHREKYYSDTELDVEFFKNYIYDCGGWEEFDWE